MQSSFFFIVFSLSFVWLFWHTLYIEVLFWLLHACLLCALIQINQSLDKPAKTIKEEYDWTSTQDIATRALTKFNTPAKRRTAASFLTIDQLCYCSCSHWMSPTQNHGPPLLRKVKVLELPPSIEIFTDQLLSAVKNCGSTVYIRRDYCLVWLAIVFAINK